MHLHRPVVLHWLLMVVAIAFAACSHAPQPTDTTARVDTFTDDYHRTVVVPSHPQRVVSLSPAVTEIIFALGAEEILVGRTDFCTYPPEASAIPSIGGISNLNIESILVQRPDLVISGSMVSRKATDQMEQMGVPMVCVIEKPRFDALFSNIAAIGCLVGCQAQADSLIATVDARLRTLADTAADSLSPRPSVYYVVGFGPAGNFTAGGNTFINDIIRLAGGRNIAAEVDGWSYSLEALMHEDPDYIIVRREDSAAFCQASPYRNLRAVRSGHVVGMVSGTMDLQVPRNIDAVRYLRHRLHPEP
ncbi:MAG: ABC transporter substrate-binding protein [Bacteroidales bacterium]|nr:ABC transporter substrate-binding protein [Bacteroidales bacterium]